MVRLREKKITPTKNHLLQFQFQHGTIERATSSTTCMDIISISIPTWYDWEAEILAGHSQYQVYFNSNMVRLREEHLFHGTSLSYRFQFQHGTIERFKALLLERQPVISIPTWYDWEARYSSRTTTLTSISIPTWYDWEQAASRATRWRDCYFNSNMVRLRECSQPKLTLCHSEFQFQHGTIESRRYHTRPRNIFISIPTWYDWEARNSKRRLVSWRDFNSNMVRLRERFAGTSARLKYISIPTWYDWEKTFRWNVSPFEIHFNSNMVRLRDIFLWVGFCFFFISIPTWYDWEKDYNILSAYGLLNFNSNMVRLRDIQSVLYCGNADISIPTWYDWECTVSLCLVF